MLEVARAPDISGSETRKRNWGRQHTDNAIGRAVERYGLVRNSRIAAEAAVPESITDHDHRLSRRLSFVGNKETPKLRFDSQQVKEICRDPCRRHLQRLALA